MQADLKTLNLKKTFSFLQNLDYNEDEGQEMALDGRGLEKTPLMGGYIFDLE